MLTVQPPPLPSTHSAHDVLRKRLGLPAKGTRLDDHLIPRSCASLARDLFFRLSIARLGPNERARKEAVARAAAAGIAELDAVADEANKFFAALARSSVEIRGCPDTVEEARLREAKIKELLAATPWVWRQRVRHVSLELMASGTADEVYAHVAGELWSAVRGLVRSLFSSLDSLLLATRVGVIDWLAGDVCRYRFFRAVVIQERGQEQVTLAAGRETRRQEVTETHRLAEHTHELINARADRLPAEQVRKPAAVEELLWRTPAWLTPYLRVVSGDQIREVILETDTRTDTHVHETERIVYRPDPALTLGRYVLAGWSERDLPPLGVLDTLRQWMRT